MESTGRRIKAEKIFSALVVSLVIALLCLPLVQMSLRIFPDLESQENRTLAAKPHFKPITLPFFWNYIQDYEKYFNDNFGFRNVLIRVNSFVNLKIFGVSPTPMPDIVVGGDGWLFYNVPNDGSSLEDYYGLAGFTPNQLSALQQNMKSLRREAEVRGILLILVIAPSKHTIYKEYLPARVAMMKGTSSRVDQLDSAWGRDDSHASLIDTRRLMVTAKNEMAYPLYYKTDSHWNNLGAFVAYSAVMKEVHARYHGVKVLGLADFELSSAGIPGRDLAGMVNMVDLMTDTEVILKPHKAPAANCSHAPYAYSTAVRSEVGYCNGPSLLAFGDSFLHFMLPYLSESFCKGTFLGSPLTVDFSIIDRESPDVVVVELAERYAGSLKIVWPDASPQHKERPQRWIFPPSSGG